MKHTVLKWIWHVTGRHKLSIAVLLLLQMILGISSVAFALVMKEVIDAAVEGMRQEFLTFFLIVVGIAAGDIMLRAMGRHLEEYTRASIENACKSRLFSALLEKEYSRVTGMHSGEWLNRLTSDTVVCASGAVEIVPGIAGMLVKMVGALVMILVLEPRFAYVLLPGGTVLIALTYALRKVLKRLHKQVQEKDGAVRIFLQERLEQLLIVRSFAAEDITRQSASERMQAHKSARMTRMRFTNVCNVGFAGAMNGIYLLGLGYCGYGIMNGSFSYGTLMAILQLIGQVQSPFANITGYLPKFYAMTASAERLIEAEHFADDCPEGVKDEKEIHAFYQELSAIGLTDADFSYRAGDHAVVLENISVRIQKGEFVALTGHSGCGKSTLLLLLMCLYPLSRGERWLLRQDGEKLPLTSAWHRLFAYVPQGNQLMSGTIREVVTFAAKAYDEERLWQALQIACAEEFIKGLSEGLDYELGERGKGLSEGQMQRIAIARAIYCGNPILLLDESTSALDEETEHRVLDNIRRITDRTVIIVTHRPAALRVCDTIISMTEEGMKVNHEANRI